MYGIRKTLYRYSDEGRVSSIACIHNPSTCEQSEEKMEGVRVSLLPESAPVYKYFQCSERSTEPYKQGVTVMECEAYEKDTKRLNIPSDEVVYQDLIALSGNGIDIKTDELNKLVDKPRKHKKLDPEPDFANFFRPTKQEFLFFEAGRNAELSDQVMEDCQGYYNFMTIECDEKVSNDIVSDAEGDIENGKLSVFGEMNLENLDMDMCSIEKFRLLHESYGLDPPQLKSHLEGSSLYNRSRAWKID